MTRDKKYRVGPAKARALIRTWIASSQRSAFSIQPGTAGPEVEAQIIAVIGFPSPAKSAGCGISEKAQPRGKSQQPKTKNHIDFRLRRFRAIAAILR
jgi:hypothetical protein